MVNVTVPTAPVTSLAFTVTVYTPGAPLSVPVMWPLAGPIFRPGGRPVAEYFSVRPAVESWPCMATNTAVPVSSCVPGSASVTMLTLDEFVNAAVPSGVPRPVGPS